MTLSEVSKLLGYSEKTIKTSLARTQESLEKNKGIILIKKDTNNYEVKYIDNFTPPEKKSKQQKQTRLIGQKFGALTVLEDTGKRLHRSVVWLCQCDCGNFHEVTSNNLNGGQVNSCGKQGCPYHKTFEDLTGQRFGSLVAIKPTSVKDGYHMYWLCQCDCGNTHEVASNHLKRGSVTSCGCLKISLGEKIIKEIFDSNGIEYKEQVSFPDLIGEKRALRFDFGIYQNNNLVRLIEFDGE